MSTKDDNSTKVQHGAKLPVSCRLSNKDVLIIKKQILKCLTEDFKNNQAIFIKDGFCKGCQVFNGTDLDMVMDKVVKGLKFSQSVLNGS